MSSSKDDVLQFLDSLDGDANTTSTTGTDQTGATASRDRTVSTSSASGLPTTGAAPGGGADNQDEQSVLDFLDEITQSASTPVDTTKATPPGSQGKSSFSSTAALPSKYLQQQQQQAAPQQQQQQQAQVDTRSSWLGSLWSTASEAVKNTQTVVQSSVKATMESQATKNLEERVKGFVTAENIGKIGMFFIFYALALGFFFLERFVHYIVKPFVVDDGLNVHVTSGQGRRASLYGKGISDGDHIICYPRRTRDKGDLTR